MNCALRTSRNSSSTSERTMHPKVATSLSAAAWRRIPSKHAETYSAMSGRRPYFVLRAVYTCCSSVSRGSPASAHLASCFALLAYNSSTISLICFSVSTRSATAPPPPPLHDADTTGPPLR